MSLPLEVIVLAAGEGTRMQSRLPKVLHCLGGEPLLRHVLRAAKAMQPDRIHVVYGHGGEEVRRTIGDDAIDWVPQEKQLGTGHAVRQVLPAVGDDKQVLVLYGDVPLISTASLEALREAGRETLAIMTTTVESPAGYGRILRGETGEILRIVEEKDATDAERGIREVNTGFLSAPSRSLAAWLSGVGNDNSKGEYYLTDIVRIAVAAGVSVGHVAATDPWEVAGVNKRSELALLEREYQKRRALALADRGVTVLDPWRLDLRGEVEAGGDCVIDVNVVLEGPVVLGSNVRIGANCFLRRVHVGDDVEFRPNSVVEDAVVGSHARIGPFARVRPGTRMGEGVHVGNFVEIKNSDLGGGAKVNHLSYVGDSSVGAHSNVGAGVITCNYDGTHKHRTTIGDDAFIGSDSQLVAPVRIGNGATVGAGSTITQDVPDNALAVSRSRQRNIKGWKRPSED